MRWNKRHPKAIAWENALLLGREVFVSNLLNNMVPSIKGQHQTQHNHMSLQDFKFDGILANFLPYTP
jgi:hypothetical protein